MNEIQLNSVYMCDFEQLPNGEMKVWLIDAPNIISYGDSIADCEEGLEQILSGMNGDILPVFEYLRPLPDSEYPQLYQSEKFVVLGAYERGELQNDVNTLFDNNICGLCMEANGKRNDEVLRIKTGKTNADIIFISISINYIVSEKLVEALNLAEYFEIRNVIITNSVRYKYFELIPPFSKRELNSVAVKKQSSMLGTPQYYFCPECGKKNCCYLSEKGFNYVVEDKSIEDIDDAFLLHGNLVVKRSLWNAVQESGIRLRKVGTSQLGVANSANILRAPIFKTVGE